MPQREAVAIVFSQPHGEQRLKPLAVGDTGQRVFFGQAVQRLFEDAAFLHVAQAATQHIGGQTRHGSTNRWRPTAGNQRFGCSSSITVDKGYNGLGQVADPGW
jgi:hypothetical protein